MQIQRIESIGGISQKAQPGWKKNGKDFA